LSNGVQERKSADDTSLQACLPCQLRDKVVKHKQGQQPEIYTLHLCFRFPLPCFFGSKRAHFFCRYALFALLKFPEKSPTGNELCGHHKVVAFRSSSCPNGRMIPVSGSSFSPVQICVLELCYQI
jgi:hypothetical protein